MPPPAAPAAWPPGEGRMARLIREHDWAATPPGPAEAWPDRLRTAVEIMLADPRPTSLTLAAGRTFLFNDAAARLYGPRAPGLLGLPLPEAFPSYPAVAPLYDRAFAGEAAEVRALPLAVSDDGGEAFDATLVPVGDGAGGVLAVLATSVEVSARLRTEAAQRASETRLRGVLDGMGEAFGLMDRDFRILAQNEAALRLDGRPLDAIVGRSHWEVYPGTRDTELGRLLETAMAERVPVTLEHRYAWPEGGASWLEMRAFPVPEGLAVFWRDITGRKEAEERLRQSEEKYRALFTSMDEAYAVVEVMQDQAGRWSDFLFLEVNPAFMAHTGMPYPVGRTATELLGTPNPRWAETYGRVLDTGEPVRLEESEFTLDRIFDLNIFRLGGEGSRRVAVLFANVTERRRAEQKLRESEARYRLLFENMTEGFALGRMIWDADGRPVDWRYEEVNPAWAQTGVPVARTVGRTAREVNPAIEPGWIETYGRVVRTGEPAAYEAYAAGFGKWFETVAFRHSEDRFGLLFRDVSERRRADDERRAGEARQVFLLRLADALRPLADPAQIQAAATALLREQVDAGWCYYVEWNEAGTVARVLRDATREGLPSLAGEHDVSDVPEFVDLLRTGETLNAPDYAGFELLSPRIRGRYAALGFRSMLGVPLVKDGRLVATLLLGDTVVRPWSDGAIALAGETAERTWAAVERARAEQRLRESEERLRAFGGASAGALWVRDAATWAFAYVSPAVEAIYGVPSEAVLADAELIHSLIAPEARERVSANVERVGRGETVVQEYPIRRATDGAVRWVRSTGFPLRDGDGRVRRIGAIVQDVTESRLAEQALVQSEERFRAIVETARDYAIFTTDADGRIDQWPPGAQAVFGWSAAEAVGQPVDTTFTPEDRAAGVPARERQQAREAGQAPNVRWHLRKDGSRVFIEGVMRPLQAPDGTLTGFVKVGQDVTEQRALQDRLKVLVAELQHRTRNLLSVVQAVSRKTLAGARSIEDFEAAFHDRMAALARVNSLLSRLTEGDRITFDELIRIELLAHGVLDRDGRGPQVGLDGPDGVRLKSSTVQTLALALHELATNAVKYGALAQRGGRLAVRWRRQEGDGRSLLRVEWIESGVVMPEPGAAPPGSGYGRELIEQALPYQLGATTTFALTPDGVHCTILLPLSATEGTAAAIPRR